MAGLIAGGVFAFASFIAGAAIAGAEGETIAENITDIVADEVSNIVFKMLVKNNTHIFVENVVQIDSDCEFKGNIVQQRNVISIDTATMNKVFQSEEVVQHMKIKIDQIAEAIAEKFKLGGGDLMANNVLNLTMKMSTNIETYITTDCSQTVIANNTVHCEERGSSTDNFISQENFVNVFKTCMQRTIMENAVDQKLDADITQRAKAETKNAFAWVLFAVAVTVCILLAITIRTIVKSLSDWRFIAASTPIVLLSIYLVVADRTNAWPFTLRDFASPKNNENIVFEPYENDDVKKSPFDVCKENGHHSVQYVEYNQNGVLLFSHDIMTPRNVFKVACRKRPSPLVKCPEDRPYQCPNLQGGEPACCETGELCDASTGFCSQ